MNKKVVLCSFFYCIFLCHSDLDWHFDILTVRSKIKTQVYDDILNTGAVQLEPGKPFFWNENDHYTGFVYFNFDLWMFLFLKQQSKLKKPIFSNKFWKANG